MSLYRRLEGSEEPKISVHTFMALLAEFNRNEVTSANISVFFALTASEVTELTALLSNVTAKTVVREDLHDVFLLLESGFYQISDVKSRLSTT